MARAKRDWSRQYPPLTVFGVVLALAIFTLPSALNLPQTNPTQLTEYAPVPGSNAAATTGANFAGLGVAEANGLTSALGGGSAGQLFGPGNGSTPSTKRCVGNPPRQTEDPLSPPCVASYTGKNGGGTWVGVTGSEITVVFRYGSLDNGGNCYPAAEANNCGPPSGLYDMDNSNDVSQFMMWRFLHDWEVYFNARYQTYSRHVHFYAYNYGDTAGYVRAGGYTTSESEAEAAYTWSKIHPLAALDEFALDADNFGHYLADRHVLAFGSGSFSAANAVRYPGLYWAYQPPPERRAQEYATYVCTKISSPGKVTFSGNGDLGQPRKYGVLLSDDAERPEARKVQDLAMAYLKQDCGLVPSDTAFFHYAGAAGASGPRSGWGPTNMATFKKDAITTILWPGGMEGEDISAADRVQYFPEWVVLGDGVTDANSSMGAQPRTETTHMFTVGPVSLINADGLPVEKACRDAILEVDPSVPSTDFIYACNDVHNGGLFDNTRQLFTGIQLSGPVLNPQNINLGFHAIPPRPSPSPYQPSCFYDPGDYSCVKDAVAEWFEVSTPCGSGASSSSGCYRMWRNGQRFLPGQWPSGDAIEGELPSDLINLYSPGLSYSLRPN